MRHQNLQLHITGFFLSLLIAGLAGATASPPPPLLAAASQPAPATAGVAGVPAGVPWLSGLAPQERLRVVKWMLTVSDDRRLVALFDDLRGPQKLELKERAATARQRLESMAAGLERAGHRVPEAARGPLDRVEENAPPPNYFPPSLIKELERLPNDPEAARMLEEARRTSPPSRRPPGR